MHDHNPINLTKWTDQSDKGHFGIERCVLSLVRDGIGAEGGEGLFQRGAKGGRRWRGGEKGGLNDVKRPDCDKY